MIPRPMILLLCVVALQGCQTYTLIEPGSLNMGMYVIDPTIEWSRAPGPVESWTVDGFALQELLFVSGIRDGERLFEGIPEDQGRAFREDMRSSDLAELFVESFSLITGAAAIEIEELRPAEFGPWEGFRFGMSYASASGLEERAIVAGTVVDSQLHIIMYRGAHHYYFEKYLPQVETLLTSIRPS